MDEIYARFGPETAVFFFKVCVVPAYVRSSCQAYILILQAIFSFSFLWNATVFFSKISVLLMYVAIIPIPSMITWVKVIGGLILLWNTSNILAGFLICRPLAKSWDFATPGTCGSQPAFYFAMGIVNLITDGAIIVLPMPYLYRLQLATGRKVLAMSLLGIGIGLVQPVAATL